MPTPTFPGPAYRVQTPRLVLRCWQPADAPLLKAAIDASLDHLRPWMPWTRSEPEDLQPKIERLRQFRGQFDLGQDFIYGIFASDQKAVLGGTGLHPRSGPHCREIGYWIHKDHIGQGLATEASAALCRVAFTVESKQRVEIRCDPANHASAAVPRKLGFTHEGTLRHDIEEGPGKGRDSMVWGLLATEFDDSPAAAVQIKAYDAGRPPYPLKEPYAASYTRRPRRPHLRRRPKIPGDLCRPPADHIRLWRDLLHHRRTQFPQGQATLHDLGGGRRPRRPGL